MRLHKDLTRLRNQNTAEHEAAENAVRAILAEVRGKGDAAVRRYAEEFDGYDGGGFLLDPEEAQAAARRADPGFARILNEARDNIQVFHRNQIQKPWGMFKDNGVIMGQIVRPLERVALYVPGGRAAYPSTVLMNAVPAVLAGVKDIAVFTPTKAGGRVNETILAAAACCGVHKIYRIGGAHAVAAAAYGTETVKKADKIVGPGNVYVTAAKRLVYGETDIDMAAGPSEILIIADETANPAYVAADLMSQAEHDPLAVAVLVSTSERVIAETELEIDRQLAHLKRKDIIREALSRHGAAVYAENLDKAFAVANEIAPEHLELLIQDPLAALPRIQNAGSVFLGAYTPEPLGDYLSGANHVLPTGGTARFSSPLGVYDFVKCSAYSYYPREALAACKDDVIQFALAEGLDAHAHAVSVRFGG